MTTPKGANTLPCCSCGLSSESRLRCCGCTKLICGGCSTACNDCREAPFCINCIEVCDECGILFCENCVEMNDQESNSICHGCSSSTEPNKEREKDDGEDSAYSCSTEDEREARPVAKRQRLDQPESSPSSNEEDSESSIEGDNPPKRRKTNE